MKLSEIIQLDCREKENRILLRKALVKLPFFAETDPREISVEDLEQAIKKMESKYDITYSYINKSQIDGGYYCIMVEKKNPWEGLKTIFGITIFETFAKVVIFMYAYIKNNCEKR